MTERPPVLAHQRFQARQGELTGLEPEALFTEIWRSNLWGADQSRSGLGSEPDATASLRAALPGLLHGLDVWTLLDLPCGDYAWMARTDLGRCRYLGGDIVAELVARNQALYATPDGRIGFHQLDLLEDRLPAVDAVLCRDCLVHLSFANIFRAFANLRRSGSTWLIATTFHAHARNEDAADGDWRLLNLERAPFYLPPPGRLLLERCTEADGGYADKALGVWRIDELPSL